MKKLGRIFGLFAFSFLLGFAVMYQTSDWSPINRDPAAIRNVFDFSNLSGADLNQAMKKQLIKGVAVIRDEEGLGVELGHFAMQGLGGGKVLACQEYQRVTMSFSAEGMASNGEKPRMEVEGPCEFSADMTKINPILIPVEKVLREAVADGELQYRDGRPVTLRFHGMTEEWPTQWLLTSVKLIDTKNDREVSVDKEELGTLIERPVVVNFK